MWGTTNINSNTKAASGIKNINIYEILEPEKVNTIHKNDSTTTLLVDITDNPNKSTDDADLPPDLYGSFIDKNKSEYDLIDLFQNIYVTPHQIKCKIPETNDNLLENSQIDFTEFFEKLESGHKIDWTTCNGNSYSHIQDLSQSSRIPSKSKSPSLTLENDDININKVYTQSRSFDEIIDSAISSKFSEPKTEVEIESSKRISEDVIDNFLQPKPLTPFLALKEAVQKLNYETSSETINVNCAAPSKLNNPNTAILNDEQDVQTQHKVTYDSPKQLIVPLDEKVNHFNYENGPENNKVRTQMFSVSNINGDEIPVLENIPYCCKTSLNWNSPRTSKSNIPSKEEHPVKMFLLNDSPKQHRTEILISKDYNISTSLHSRNSNISQASLEMVTRNLYENKTQPRDAFFSLNKYKNEILSPLLDLNSPQILSTYGEYTIPLLQTVKKDNKLYLKRRIVKKDLEKMGFTKGPDIFEKSVVLPQIMNRLAVRKKALNEQNNIKRKMKLDSNSGSNTIQSPALHDQNGIRSSTKTDNDHNVFEPEVLMADCNSERLKALMIRTAFETFVKTGKC